jgi:hypothetical protein
MSDPCQLRWLGAFGTVQQPCNVAHTSFLLLLLLLLLLQLLLLLPGKHRS